MKIPVKTRPDRQIAPRVLLHPKALPPFAALRAFEAVARLGGIRKAAESLRLDHAVVSRHIRLLEEWLGVPLFTRSNGRLQLTEAGRGYHLRVSSALVELASATSDLVQQGDQRSIRVWCVPGFATQWLSIRIAEFEELHPHFSIELRPTDEPADLLMHEADVDIRFYGDQWPPEPGGRGLRHLELARPPIMAVANSEVAARLGASVNVEQLLGAPLLHEENDEQWRAWFRCNGVEIATKIPGPLLWHAHLAVAAARAGRGIALASTYLIDRDLHSGELVELDFCSPTRPVIGAYIFVAREDRWSLPVVAELRRFLQALTH
jgi:DNA-binding transcriptional LysR family regulator